jgi:hypothetical protein
MYQISLVLSNQHVFLTSRRSRHHSARMATAPCDRTDQSLRKSDAAREHGKVLSDSRRYRLDNACPSGRVSDSVPLAIRIGMILNVQGIGDGLCSRDELLHCRSNRLLSQPRTEIICRILVATAEQHPSRRNRNARMSRPPYRNSMRWRNLSRNPRFNHHEFRSMMFSVSHLAELGILAICLTSRYPLSERLGKLRFAAAARVRFPQKS